MAEEKVWFYDWSKKRYRNTGVFLLQDYAGNVTNHLKIRYFSLKKSGMK